MTETRWKTVGIVGGFGPEATVAFYQKILDYCKRRVTGMRANTGYPRMIIYNCNFIPFDTDDETVPVLHIVEETAKVVKERNIKIAGIVPAHPEVGNLYRKLLARYDIEAINPDSYSQITHMIEEFMAGRSRDAAKEFFVGLMDDLKSKVETTILACTELPSILGNDLKKYQFVDSTQVLAEATVERALSS